MMEAAENVLSPFSHISDMNETTIVPKSDKSQLILSTSQLPPPVLPKTTIIDSNLIESQWKNIRKPSPPPPLPLLSISKKPALSVSNFISTTVS